MRKCDTGLKSAVRAIKNFVMTELNDLSDDYSICQIEKLLDLFVYRIEETLDEVYRCDID